MTRQLVFTLAAPFGSFATTRSAANVAVKPTVLDPPKSALIGLLGAALGWERERLGALADAFHVAVREGLRPTPDPKWDYHTITKPVRRPGGGTWTRFEELRARAVRDQKGPAGSTISRREFWNIGLWTVSLAQVAPGSPALEDVEAGLRHPRWPLYAGRKAYALGLPPDPAMIEADGPVAAHAAYGWPWERHPSLAPPTAPGGRAQEPIAILRDDMQRARSEAALRFDADYPGAPNFVSEVEVPDVPFPGVSASHRLVRGYLSRRVRSAYVPGRRPVLDPGNA